MTTNPLSVEELDILDEDGPACIRMSDWNRLIAAARKGIEAEKLRQAIRDYAQSKPRFGRENTEIEFRKYLTPEQAELIFNSPGRAEATQDTVETRYRDGTVEWEPSNTGEEVSPWEVIEDCKAFLRGDLSGSEQARGLIKEAASLLSSISKERDSARESVWIMGERAAALRKELTEAKAEISRLTLEVLPKMAALASKKQAEIERLREALKNAEGAICMALQHAPKGSQLEAALVRDFEFTRAALTGGRGV